MKLNNKVKILASAALCLSLVACGGSGDGDSGSSGSAGSSEGSSSSQAGSKSGLVAKDYVAGNFTQLEGNENYIPNTESTYFTGFCSEPSNIDTSFESKNVIVLGNRNHLPESDFVYAASIVEKGLPRALRATGFTLNEIQDMHSYITTSNKESGLIKLANLLFSFKSIDKNTIEDQNILDKYNKIYDVLLENNMHQIQETENADAIRVAEFKFLELPIKKQKEIFNVLLENQDVISEYFQESLNNPQLADWQKQDIINTIKENEQNLLNNGDVRKTKKVLVCLDESMIGTESWGTGSYLGFNVKPKTATLNEYTDRNDTQTATHELVHFIQLSVSSPVSHDTKNQPKWLLEGEAVYLSGQPINKGEPINNPFYVMTEDQQGYDLGKSYAEYGQAVSYLERHKVKSYRDLLLSYRKNDLYYTQRTLFLNNVFKDVYGQTYDDMEINYMNDYNK